MRTWQYTAISAGGNGRVAATATARRGDGCIPGTGREGEF